MCVKSQSRKIDELAQIVDPLDHRKKVFGMIAAYLDESGIHGSASVCVIAGYWGRKAQWRLLERRWLKVLSEHGLSLADFHAKDLMKSDRYKPLLLALAQTIAKYQIYPVSMGIVVDDFRALTLQERKFLTGATIRNGKLMGTGAPSKAYFVPFQLCLQTVTDYARPGEKAHFFFGLDRPFAGYARWMFSKIKTDMRYSEKWKSKSRLGDPAFPLAAETPQLQAADLLVHLTYLRMEDIQEHKSTFAAPPQGILAICLKRTRNFAKDHYYQNRIALEVTIEKAYKVAGSSWDTERTKTTVMGV